ncbi:MAG: hypothetical protein AABO58_17160 [Acidobacteriota bacterium]
MTPDFLAPSAEQRQEQWELEPGDYGRRKHDQRDDHAPSRNLPGEAKGAERAKHIRQLGQAISGGVGCNDEQRLEPARGRERRQRQRLASVHHRIHSRSHTDPQQSRGQDQPEGVRGTSEERRQHPIPDHFHEQERESHDCGGSESPARASCGRALGTLDSRRRGHWNGKPPGHQSHQEIEEGRREQGPAIPDCFQSVEGRDQASGDRPQRVGGIEDGNLATVPILRCFHGSGGRRQRASHQKRRQAEHDRGEQQANDRRAGQTESARSSQGEIESGSEPQQKRCQRRGSGDQQLQDGIEAERPLLLVDATTEQRASEAQPSHEHRQHRRRGVRRRAEDESELPQPDCLIGEGAQSRDEQQTSHDGRAIS